MLIEGLENGIRIWTQSGEVPLSFLFPTMPLLQGQGQPWPPSAHQVSVSVYIRPDLSAPTFWLTPSFLFHKTKALEWVSIVSPHVWEHLIPWAWVTKTFSYAFNLGRGDAHLGGEPGVLVAPWAIAKDPSGLSQEFWETRRDRNIGKSSVRSNWDTVSSPLTGKEVARESAVKWNGWSIL